MNTSRKMATPVIASTQSPALTAREGRQASRTRVASVGGLAAIAGGLALFADLGVHAFGGLGRGYFVVAAAVALCLPGLPLALHLRGWFAPGWRSRLALAGTVVVGFGVLLWIAAFALLYVDPSVAFTQRLTPAGSVIMALGMILVGIAAVTSRRIAGWPAVTPLLVGLYFPLQFGLQLAFFLNGRDGRPGPDGLLLGAWGLLWAVAAGATFASRPSKAE